MKDELFINGKDAYLTWGISLDDMGLSMLMTPPPNKVVIQSKSRIEHGKRIPNQVRRVDERNVSLTINLTASTRDDFFRKYESFCLELEKGRLEIRTKYQPSVLYRMEYLNCSQFSEFMQGIGKFTLKLNEPNPKDRTAGPTPSPTFRKILLENGKPLLLEDGRFVKL